MTIHLAINVPVLFIASIVSGCQYVGSIYEYDLTRGVGDLS
jgi:hypothetical protein